MIVIVRAVTIVSSFGSLQLGEPQLISLLERVSQQTQKKTTVKVTCLSHNNFGPFCFSLKEDIVFQMMKVTSKILYMNCLYYNLADDVLCCVYTLIKLLSKLLYKYVLNSCLNVYLTFTQTQ